MPPNPEIPRPHLRLRESVDYIDRHELHSKILAGLQEIGVEPEDVLLYGYDGSLEEDEPRTSISAMTVSEITEILESGLEDTPYTYAEHAFRTGGRPIVAAYSRSRFVVEPETAYGYTLYPGLTLDDATLLTAELVEQ